MHGHGEGRRIPRFASTATLCAGGETNPPSCGVTPRIAAVTPLKAPWIHLAADKCRSLGTQRLDPRTWARCLSTRRDLPQPGAKELRQQHHAWFSAPHRPTRFDGIRNPRMRIERKGRMRRGGGGGGGGGRGRRGRRRRKEGEEEGEGEEAAGTRRRLVNPRVLVSCFVSLAVHPRVGKATTTLTTAGRLRGPSLAQDLGWVEVHLRDARACARAGEACRGLPPNPRHSPTLRMRCNGKARLLLTINQWQRLADLATPSAKVSTQCPDGLSARPATLALSAPTGATNPGQETGWLATTGWGAPTPGMQSV